MLDYMACHLGILGRGSWPVKDTVARAAISIFHPYVRIPSFANDPRGQGSYARLDGRPSCVIVTCCPFDVNGKRRWPVIPFLELVDSVHDSQDGKTCVAQRKGRECRSLHALPGVFN